jgi:hypothetical protein
MARQSIVDLIDEIAFVQPLGERNSLPARTSQTDEE